MKPFDSTMTIAELIQALYPPSIMYHPPGYCECALALLPTVCESPCG
jgi:hypothetical protein